MYPPYEYVRQQQNNTVLEDILSLVASYKGPLQEIRDAKHAKSQDIEKVLLDGLSSLGFVRSVTNKKIASIFGPAADFEIDFFCPELKIAIEVEKGRNFNIWKDICKFIESPLVEHGVIIVPAEKTNKRVKEKVFYNTIRQLGNVERTLAHLQSLVIVGY